MAIRRTSSQTLVNRGVAAAAATPVNIITGSGGAGATVNISSIQIANSTFVAKDDLAIDTTGGFMIINGTGFKSGAVVYIQGTAATSTSFVSSSRLNVTVPALSSGVLDVYVVNTDGSGSIYLRSLSANGTPSWTTTSTLTPQDTDALFAINLVATGAAGDGTITYAVSSGSSLPSGTFLSSNGYFYGTVTGLSTETTYSFSVDAIDVQNQETARTFSITVRAGDPYFNLTSLLLNADVDTWITDASTNKFALTVNGDTRPMAFSPYETVWSNYFDGTGDYLSIPASSNFNFGTGDYTIEGWINTSTLNWTLYATGGSGAQDQMVCDNGTLYWAYSSFGGGVANYFTTSDLNKWTHVAVSRASNITKIFKNGTEMASSSTVASIGSSVNALLLGRRSDGIYHTFGYMSNIRVLKGTALYTSAFTPPTSPLTAITNTVLLTCQSNRLIDNSTNNFAITRNGDVTVSNFGPFVETDVTSGSAYFDGTGDYFTTVESSTAFNFDTGDFTVESWVYPIAASTAASETYYHLVGTYGSYSPGQNVNWTFLWNLQGVSKLRLARFSSGTVSAIESNTVTLVYNTWQHWAVVRQSGIVTFYLNGVSVGGGSFTANINITQQLLVGAAFGGDTPFSVAWTPRGYTSNLRIVKGTAVYTSNFTPPVNPLTAIANTSLLTLQSRIGENNNRFVDSSGMNNIITRNGNTTQGTFTPFSQNGWSYYFDGSSTLTYTGSPISTSQSNFTIEAWVYPTAAPTFGGSVGQIVVDASGTAGGSFWGFGLTASLNVVFRWWTGAVGPSVTSNGSIPLNQWSHIAVSVNSNSITLYINGTQQSVTGTSTLTNRGGNTGFVNIGRYATTDQFYGYISNVRLIAGTGLYTSSFTPAIAPLTAVSNTSLLTCQSNRFVDNSTNNVAISVLGSPSVQAFSPFKPTTVWSPTTVGGSIYFDGTGDYLTAPRNSSFFPGASTDFTIEAWVYPISFPDNVHNSHQVVGVGEYGTRESTDWAFSVNSSRTLSFYLAATNIARTTTATINLNSWNHIAVCRSGSGSNNLTIYVNGVGQSYTETGSFTYSGSSLLSIGADTNGDEGRMHGYLSGLRMINGRNIYSGGSISIPTTPSTPVASTTLLLNGTNGGIIDYTSENNLETVGDAKIRNSVVKYGSGAMYFDGTGDYLAVSTSDIGNFGTGDFTIEMWIYFNTVSGTQNLIDFRTATADVALTLALAGGAIILYVTGSTRITTSTLSATTWYHVACVRSSGVTRIYINGTQSGSNYTDTNSYVGKTNRPWIGALADGTTPAQPLNAYIDDLRITKGVARYTANFTPPTAHKLK